MHIGIDNKTVVDNFHRLQQAAAKTAIGGEPQGCFWPLGKPWTLVSDGDLWASAWKLLNQRGHCSIRVSKVKGHATAEEVGSVIGGVLVTQTDKEGKGNADTAAQTGANAHKGGTMPFLAWLRRKLHSANLIVPINGMATKVLTTRKAMQDKNDNALMTAAPKYKIKATDVTLPLRNRP